MFCFSQGEKRSPHSTLLDHKHRWWVPAPTWEQPLLWSSVQENLSWIKIIFLLKFLLLVSAAVVQSLSRVQLFATPWTATFQASLSFTISGSLLKLMSIELVIPSNHLTLGHLFSSCLQSLPASESFPMIRLSASGGQSTGASVLASVLPVNVQDWFPLGWTGWISLQSKGLSSVFYSTTVW